MTCPRTLTSSRILISLVLVFLALAVSAAAPAHDPDQIAPTAPVTLSVGSVTATSVALTWTPASDDVGVARYTVLRNGSVAGTTETAGFTFVGLECGSSFAVAVEAYDAAGNHSTQLTGIVATSPCSNPATSPAPEPLPAVPVPPVKAPAVEPPAVKAPPPTAPVKSPPVKARPVKAPSPAAPRAVAGSRHSIPAGNPEPATPTVNPEPATPAGNPEPSPVGTPAPSTPPASAPPAPAGAVSYVSPSGSNVAACTQAAPCASWNRAYQLAQPGQRIQVAAGTYPAQVIQSRTALRKLSGCTPADTSKCVVFEPQGPVTIDGVLEVRGSSVYVKGSRSTGGPAPGAGYSITVKGSASVEANSVSDYPDNVIFEGIDTNSTGVFGADTVTFKNMDVGPATVVAPNGQCYVKEGSGFENKIGYGGGVMVTPKNITWDGLRIHDQNGDPSRELGDGGSGCHWGGLFLVAVDGLTIRNSVFERNVVYNVQIQGNPATLKNVLFDTNSFGCPVDWKYRGDVCDGQRSIQFDGAFPSVTLRNNLSANGTGWDGSSGLYGCYVGSCGGFAGNVFTGNKDLPDSTTAPAF